MDAITRDLDQHLREIQQEAERSRREQAALQKAQEREETAKLHVRKQEAIKTVDEAATRAVSRIDWRERGCIYMICNRRGPHKGFWCGLHRRKIALVKIPRAVAPLYLGSDHRIYRSGRYKIYIAELDKRDWPAEILNVAELLDAM